MFFDIFGLDEIWNVENNAYFCGQNLKMKMEIQEYDVDNWPFTTYINPRTDFGFKKIFGQPKLMKSFLSAVCNETITEVEYQNTEQLGAVEEDRNAFYDVLCTNDKGEHFIVEMQNAPQKFILDRLLYYASVLIQNQAPKGRWSFELKAVYVIAILNFRFFADTEADKTNVVERLYLTRENNPSWEYGKLHLKMVELPKFKKALQELENEQDRWFYNLRHLEEMSAQPQELRDEIFNLLFNIAGIAALSKGDKDMYIRSLHRYNDFENCVNFAGEKGEQRAWAEANAIIAERDRSIAAERARVAERDRRIAELEQLLQKR